MDFHYYARFCSKRPRVWLEFPSAGMVGWQRRREDCELYWKGKGLWLEWSPLKTQPWFATVCQGSSWAMLWYSQKSLVKAVGVLELIFFCSLAGFIDSVARFLPLVGRVCSQKCTLLAEFRRDEWWCRSSKTSVRVHGDAHTSTGKHGVVFWQWMYNRESVEGSLLWTLSLQASFSLNNILTTWSKWVKEAGKSW